MHMSSYTLTDWLKGDMQLHTKERLHPEISCKMGRNRFYVYFTTGQC